MQATATEGEPGSRRISGGIFMRSTILKRLLIAAAFGLGFSALPIARASAQSIDAANLGNEVIDQIESIVRILNKRTCITEEEALNMRIEVEQLQAQIEGDRHDL